MIPRNITREHVLKAIKEIERNRFPRRRNSRKFILLYEGKSFPPKYVVSLANKYANGIELNSSKFCGGEETNRFLRNLGFPILDKSFPPGRREPIIDIRELIEKGENENIEFKSSMCWDYEENRKNKLIESTIAKTVSAFMNSEGGYLFIGIGDEKQILGLDKDFAVIRMPNKNGYELHFTNLINKYLGKENRPYAKIMFETLDGKIVAVVKVNKCPNPVYIKSEGKEEFYIRLGNSSHPLNIREATVYIENHWQ